MTGDAGYERLAAAVDEAAAAVSALETDSRLVAERLKLAVEAAHRDALVTIVRRLRADARGRELLFELVDDPMVRTLFSLHGIIRSEPAPAEEPPAASGRPGSGCGSAGCGSSSSSSSSGPALIPVTSVRLREGAAAPTVDLR